LANSIKSLETFMRLASFALLALLTAAPMTLPTTPAAAQVQSDCAAQIESLQGAVATVAITGKNADKDRAGLTGKLADASAELSKGKNGDAAKKLADFRIKVGQLADAGRISSGDAASLTSQTDSAIACLAGPAAASSSDRETLLAAAREVA
jgi:hypothetical protein